MSKPYLIKVSGMHCKSCEMIIESKVGEVPGVKKVRAYTSRSEVKVQGDFDNAAVEKAIVAAGYRIEFSETGLLTKKTSVYLDLVLSVLLVAIIYMIFTITGIAKLLPSVSASSYSYGVVAMLGITAGFSTCMALIGGLVLGFTARYREKHPEITGVKAFIPNIYFNIGRVVGFFFLGGTLGEIGSFVGVSAGVNGWLLLLVALVMLLIGVQLTEISPLASKFSFTMPKFISNLVPSKFTREYSHFGPVFGGIGSFFLPCGFTQVVQLAAISSGSFVSGALLMSLFAIGTAPGLLLVGSLATFAKGQLATKAFRFMGVVVVALALVNLSAASNLIGLKLPEIDLSSVVNTSGVGSKKANSAVIQADGTQLVTMDVTQYGYSPNHFVVKKGVPVKWVVNVTDISTCASFLVARDLNIQQLLKMGETSFGFTPESLGTIHFTCSMGMYTGDFTVVE